jgi:hypothetical protein
MSVQALEAQVRALSPEELAKFSQWFEAYRETALGADVEEEELADLSEAQKAELLRRVEFAKNHPEALEPWEGTTERIREHLHALRGQKAA